MRSLFISDLHLTPKRPDISWAFTVFLKHYFPVQEGTGQQADALYILGDFFEYWIGDDVMDEFQLAIAHQLRQLADAGINIYFMHGNRDFLVDQTFCQLAGCTLLPDPSVITLTTADHDATPVLLMHGDSLCTDDKGYQRFRRIIRIRWLQRLLLTLPADYRRRLAEKLRNRSIKQAPNRPPRLVDVTESAVRHALDTYNVKTLIHGHTHNAAVHNLPDRRQRIVLGDWDRLGGYYLYHDRHGLQLRDWNIETRSFSR